MADLLPFVVASTEKNDKCHRCNKLIEDGVQKPRGKTRTSGRLKLGEMIQSKTEDSKVPLWYHVECFFNAKKDVEESQIQGFATLCNTDKAHIRRHMESRDDQAKPNVSTKKRARAADDVCESTATVLNDYRVESCDEAVNTCQCCFSMISKKKIGITKTIANTIKVWYHAKCFEKHSLQLGWNEAPEKFPGFDRLCKKDKIELKSLFGIKADENNNEPNAKRLKLGDINDVNDIIGVKIKLQNREFSRLRNQLQEHLKQPDYVAILEENNQFIPTEPYQLLNHVADVIYFGPLNDCKECKTGKLVFNGNDSYLCNGTISSYAKCTNNVKMPPRRSFEIPKKVDAAFFKTKFRTKQRAIKLPTGLIKSIGTRLRGLEFIVDDKLQKPKREIKSAIEKMKGKVGHFISSRTAAIISDAEGIEEMGPYMTSARNLGIQVVPVDFLEMVKISDPFTLINDLNLSPWKCTDPSQRIPRNGVLASKPDDYIDSKPKTHKWKNGNTIDADCKLENVHVHPSCCNSHFTAIMSLVDISTNKNSYHRMQLLVSDDNKRFWIFQKSGRIGTVIGKTVEKEYNSIGHAEAEFRKIFMDLTGNNFDPHSVFVKQPDKYHLLEIESETQKDVIKSLVQTKLEARKYELMQLIADKKAMKDTMLKFELDTANMPLGKLRKAQIDIAMDVLKELSTMVNQNASRNQLVEASNRFYTMIPHTFGENGPTVLDKIDEITNKMDMLNHLANIRLTYSLLNGNDQQTNPLDHLYQQLNASVEALDRKSVEFADIQKYIRLTKYRKGKIDVVNAFEVMRQGETQRFDKFKNLDNRQLLWHGSSLTNFVGLLSKGLMITPPDVQTNGSNFGRGLYFADAIAKSLNYCSQSAERVALLLLCEVALGKSLEVTNPQHIGALPVGIHSTKCLGARSLNGFKKRSDGLLIPNGNKIKDDTKPMRYNEFIVYDEAQVRIKYLVMVRLGDPHSQSGHDI